MLQIKCPHCRGDIQADGELRFPPWCRKCGGDLKVTAKDLESARPAPPQPAFRPPSLLTEGPRSSGQMPAAMPCAFPEMPRPCSFSVRINERRQLLYRAFLLPGEVLFLDRTAWQFDVLSVVAGGLGGMLLGAMVRIATHEARAQANARKQRMDYACAEELLMMAADDPNSFRLDAADLSEVRLDPPTGWQALGLFTSRCAAIVTCWYREKTLTWELPEPDDVRRVLNHLVPFLDEEVAVNIVWEGERQRYVAAT